MNPADLKEEANNLYYEKKFDEAIAKYEEAERLDPTNMVYRSNIGAVFYEMKDYQKSIEACFQALEIGNQNRADFKLKARAYQRIGNCYSKMGDLENAIEYYNKSLVEESNRTTQDLLRTAQRELEEKKKRDYINPELADRARLEGNEFFKQQKFPEAVASYTEAIKKNPTDKVPYTNRATAFLKLGEIPDAIKDCEKAIELDPNFVKAYIKKAHAHYIMSDYPKALQTYEKALELESNNGEIEQGITNTLQKINEGQDEETVRRNVENNPEIMQILQDPMMQKVLQDFQNKDRNAILAHLQDPEIMKKLDKLRTAGIIKTG